MDNRFALVILILRQQKGCWLTSQNPGTPTARACKHDQQAVFAKRIGLSETAKTAHTRVSSFFCPHWPNGIALAVAGTGMLMMFGTHGETDTQAGIDSVWEGTYGNGVWTPGRELNGDEDNQGRSLRMPAGSFTIRRVHLYHYR